jgi:hypothetical protein
MTRRAAIIACCVLLSSMAVAAQSGGAKNTKPDAITGTWSGELAPKNLDRPIAVTLSLKFDGKSAVSGTIKGLPNPGDVKSGTFDTKTGALKLQLGKAGDSAVLIVLEGKVIKGTATGTVTGDGGDGPFKLTKQP